MPAALGVALACLAAPLAAIAERPEPLVYTVRVSRPSSQRAEVEVQVPTGRAASVEMMMPLWSPGFYRVEDYEAAPRTKSLWVAEGLTNYCVDLVLSRSGLYGVPQFLKSLSSAVGELQGAPGRLQQTLEQSSEEVWNNSLSGINPASDTVSYYVKGHVVGFLLDAKVRRATEGRKSLRDVMRLAYARYSGERGFTPEEFEAIAQEVAGEDLTLWFHRAVASTEELDYAEALDWFGLRFAAPGPAGAADTWRLEPRPNATRAQRSRLKRP